MIERLVINLPQSKDRLKNITRIFTKAQLSFKRIDAIDGKTLDLNGVRVKSNYGKQLAPSEIGCFLSHKKCWEYILQKKLDGAFIFEDDIQILDHPLLQSNNWIPSSIEVIQLSFFPSNINQGKKFYRSPNVITINNSFSLVQLLRPIPWGTQAYWISASGAQEALLLSETITEPVDHFLFDQRLKFCRKTQVYSLHPAIIIPDNSDSLIESDRKGASTGKIPLPRKLRLAFFQTLFKATGIAINQDYIRHQ